MNHLLRPRIWPSFSPSCKLYEPEAERPRLSDPATYCSSSLGSNPAARGTVARWHSHLHGLATEIHETSGLGNTAEYLKIAASANDNL